MKKIITLIASAITILGIASCSVPRTAEEIAATDALITKALNNGEFNFEVTRIYPTKGGPRTSFDGYTLKVKDGVVNTRLPFFGESTLVTYGSTDEISITLKDAPVRITKEQDKKDWVLKFEGSNERETYQFLLTIFDNGNADLSVFSNNRSTMRYSGELKEFPVENQ